MPGNPGIFCLGSISSLTNWREMIEAKEPENATASKADGWFTPGRFAALLAGFIAVTFSGILFGQETFFYRDFGLFGYPLASYHRECFWRGEVPLWNPLNCCGLPFLAQWNTLTLYPPSLFYLVFPLSWSLGVFNLAHLFWAGLGMYFLAYWWTGNRLAASVAGLAFAFNGLTWHSLMWPNNIAALGWMPWVVLLVERAWSCRGARAVVVAALAGAMQMLAGAPEIILLTWLLLGAMWAAELVRGGMPRRPMIGRFLCVCGFVAGLTAAQLLPFLELLAHSHRSPEFSKADDWAMPLSGPANFLVPLFHCFEAGHGVFVQRDQYWIPSHYLGAGLMVLAVTGAYCARKRQVWLLLALAVFSVWMALGAHGYLYLLARKVMPLLGVMRYSIKFVVLAMFTIPLLAAYGVSWYQSQADESDSRWTRKTLQGVAVTLLGLMAVIVWLAWRYPMVKDNWNATWQSALGRAAFVVLVPGILILLERKTQFKLQVLLRLGLLVLLWMDVYTHAPNLNPTVQRSVYEPGLMRVALKLPPQQPGEPRFLETPAAMQNVHAISLSDPANQYLCDRLALYDNCNLLDDVPKCDGFYSLYLRETMHTLALMDYALDGYKMDPKGMKDFLGVAHIGTPDTNPGRALDWTERSTALPLVTAGQQPVFASDADTDKGLVAANFDPRQTIYLPLEARGEVKAGRADAKIIAPQIESQRMRFEVQADAPAVVAVAQAYYQPWHAYVDGKQVKLWRANGGFQALEVPAGRHAVKVVYEDRMFQTGAVLSCASLFMLGLIWITGRRTTG